MPIMVDYNTRNRNRHISKNEHVMNGCKKINIFDKSMGTPSTSFCGMVQQLL